MLSVSNIVLEVTSPGVPPTMRAVQEDVGTRFAEITLLADGDALQIPDGCAAMVGVRRPNGTYVLYDVDEGGNPAVNFYGNVATVYISQAALAVAGTAYCDLVLSEGGRQLTTFHFNIEIEGAAVPSEEVVESDYFNILTQQIAAAQQLVEDAQGIVDDCEDQADRAQDEADRAEQYASSVQYPVSYGGEQTLTSTQKETARSNISAAGASVQYNAVLYAASWNDDEYDLALVGVTSSSVVELYPAEDITEAELAQLQRANIHGIDQAAGSVTLKAFGTVPTEDIPIGAILRGDL